MEEFAAVDQFGFDEKEKETMKMSRAGSRVAPPRQLGDWITIDIDASKKEVSCNCERCNTNGKCSWVAVFEVLQFWKELDEDLFNINLHNTL